MTERGLITLARGVLDHPVVGAGQKYSTLEAWLWLLFEAAWKPRRVRTTNGRAVGTIAIERGQLSYSRSYIATAWGWSEKRVRTFLHRLEQEGMIDRQTGHLQLVITIVNYEKYQTPQAHRGQQTDQQWANNGPETEQGNKGTKDNTRSCTSEPDGFNEWYAAFPKRVDRRAAAKAYKAAIARGDCNAKSLLVAAQRCAVETADTERKFIKHPATWLNASSYLNETPAPAPAPTTTASGGGLKIEPPTRDARSFTEAEWRDRLAMFRSRGEWSETYWGPRPGAAGCWVPSHLLLGPVEREPKNRGRQDEPPYSHPRWIMAVGNARGDCSGLLRRAEC